MPLLQVMLRKYLTAGYYIFFFYEADLEDALQEHT